MQTANPKSSTGRADTVVKSTGDSFILGERIDGPANIRDTVNGRLLFILDDNTNVTANEPQNKWLQIGVFADLTKEQMDKLSIDKGSKIFVRGAVIGEAKENVDLQAAFQDNKGLHGELVGYTAASNIKANTIPENILSKIVNEATEALTLNECKLFLKDFQFNEFDGLLPQFKGYEIDENWIDDPSALLRLWLLFENDRFYGVFHSRPLNLKNVKTVRVERGFYLSTFARDDKTTKELVNKFNSYIVQVD